MDELHKLHLSEPSLKSQLLELPFVLVIAILLVHEHDQGRSKALDIYLSLSVDKRLNSYEDAAIS